MRKFVLLLGCFAAGPVAAGEARLTGEAIKTTLGGSLIALDTPVGSTVSVRVGHDGMVTGEAGSALGAVLGAAKDRGRWWVAQDQVCFKWFRWFDAEQRCVTITVDGNRFMWRKDDGDTGTGTIVEFGKPIVKSPTIVAEAKGSDALSHKPHAKKSEVVAVADTPVAETHHDREAKPSPSVHSKPAASAEPSLQRTGFATEVALHVPEPRPAVRPKHHDEIAVASVKAQFFAAAKSAKAKKGRPATSEVAKAEIAKPSAPKAAPTPFRVAGVDPSDVLNIRNGPSSDYQTVGSIAPDSRGITMTGPCQNDWCPVKHRTLVGWVNRRYLTEETAANTAAIAETNYWDPAP